MTASRKMEEPYCITGRSFIRKDRIIRNERIELVNENFANFASFSKELYKREAISYPKFYKMDNLSKLGFLAAELLFSENAFLDRYDRKEIGTVIMNSSSSLDTDRAYNETIRDQSNYFPSPSLFVYTLPNIVIGEICIRHGIKGENIFLISESFDPERIVRNVEIYLDAGRAKACLCGWIEILDSKFEALLLLVERKEQADENRRKVFYAPFSVEILNKLSQPSK